MSTQLTIVLGVVIAAPLALAATPLAIRVAKHIEFYDRPRGYRQHASPTPFLGGAAVLLAFLVTAIVLGAAGQREVLILVGGLILWAIGTVDDRRAVGPQWRVLAEMLVALALYAAGMGWKLPAGDGFDLVLSVFWVVGIVNAFNLMDNLDGACGTVACVSALGIGTLAAIHGERVLTGMAFALAAACAGFLRFNLAGPAKIFLGNGGSMLVGFLVAAIGMAVSRHLRAGDLALFAIALTAGIVILDTTLVVVSRSRRGLSVLVGGRDHLSHRLLARLHSPRAVAGVLGVAQAILCLVAIAGVQLGHPVLIGLAMTAIVIAAVAVHVLDSPSWRTAREAGHETGDRRDAEEALARLNPNLAVEVTDMTQPGLEVGTID